jgi:hypothetical protein
MAVWRTRVDNTVVLCVLAQVLARFSCNTVVTIMFQRIQTDSCFICFFPVLHLRFRSSFFLLCHSTCGCGTPAALTQTLTLPYSHSGRSSSGADDTCMEHQLEESGGLSLSCGSQADSVRCYEV